MFSLLLRALWTQAWRLIFFFTVHQKTKPNKTITQANKTQVNQDVLDEADRCRPHAEKGVAPTPGTDHAQEGRKVSIARQETGNGAWMPLSFQGPSRRSPRPRTPPLKLRSDPPLPQVCVCPPPWMAKSLVSSCWRVPPSPAPLLPTWAPGWELRDQVHS